MNSLDTQKVVTRRPIVSPRVLIVEDDPETTRALEKLLGTLHIEADVFHTASAAIAQVSPLRHIAAMIDIHLPDLNGLVLAQKLRKSLGPQTPIIVFSGDTSMETLSSLAHVGATYFLAKPIQWQALRDLVGQWIP